MAFDVAQNKEIPKFTVLSKYSVYRIGQFPVADATFTECVYVMDGPAVVQEMEDLDGDGIMETISVPGLAAVTNLVGRMLAQPDSTVIGKISTATVVEVTPGVNTMKITLTTPPSDLTGQNVGVVKTMPVGTPVYRRAVGGKEWTITLDGSIPVAMQRMIVMLGNIYGNAVGAALGALGVSKTAAQISAALQALAAQGTNIDGIFAQQGEQLEMDRRGGTLSALISVTGAPPVV